MYATRRAPGVVVVAACLASLGTGVRADDVRPSVLDGSWYPRSRAALATSARYLRRTAEPAPGLPGRPLALVVPHAGWVFSGVAAAAAFRDLRPGDFDRVMVLAPSHYGDFDGYGLDAGVRAWRTPLGDVPVCREAMAGLGAEASARLTREAERREHSIEVLLPLLQSTLQRFCLVPILLGRMSADQERALASRLAGLHDGRTLFVFSSDLVHYGERYRYVPFGLPIKAVAGQVRALDDRVVSLVAAGDAPRLRALLDETKATVCGAHALLTLLELAPRLAPESGTTIVARYASHELPFLGEDSWVGYVSLGLTRERAVPTAPQPLGVIAPLPEVPADAWQLPAPLGASLARLARAALETELVGGDALERALDTLEGAPELRRRQGAFVTLLRKDPAGGRAADRLRGCRGQAEAVLPLDLAIVQAALEAAFDDERFPRLRAEELASIDVEVTVLSPLREVASASEYRRGRDGLALTKDKKGALFLPQVWRDEGWAHEEALVELSRKARLPDSAWRDGARLLAFEGQEFRHDGVGAER